MTTMALAFIKALQWLMLLAATAALLYGAWHLGQRLRWQVMGTSVNGTVVEVDTRTEKRRSLGTIRTTESYYSVTLHRPRVEYADPNAAGTRHHVSASIMLEGVLAEPYEKGMITEVRIDPRDPHKAYLVLPLAAYFWPFVALFAGLAGVLLIGGLFYLPEAAFGRDVSAGLSLLRGLRGWHVAAIIVVAAVLFWTTRATLPWLGRHEALVIATGELRLLPALLKTHGPPPPGEFLNASEAAVVRWPWLGPGYATSAIEQAIAVQDRSDINRYLDAYAAAPERFPIQSPRLLYDAVQQRDLATLKRLLALGFRSPGDTDLFDPLRAAEQANLPEFIAALRAAAHQPETSRR